MLPTNCVSLPLSIRPGPFKVVDDPNKPKTYDPATATAIPTKPKYNNILDLPLSDLGADRVDFCPSPFVDDSVLLEALLTSFRVIVDVMRQ